MAAADLTDEHESVVVVWRGMPAERAREMTLVLDAIGIRCGLQRVGLESSVIVAAADAQRARTALEGYARENESWPPPPDQTVSVVASGWRAAVVYIVVIAIFHHLRLRSIGGFDWWWNGQTRSMLITDGGEWWRVVTSLFLHADIQHLVGNALFGALFAVFVSQLYGAGWAWLATLFTGALGNLTNAYVRGPGHASIGASTAVFGALGIVVAAEWARRGQQARPLRRWGPPFLGVCLLAFLGTEGERTDVMAHVWGFAWGLALGRVMASAKPSLSPRAGVQWALGGVVFLIAAACWVLALSPR